MKEKSIRKICITNAVAVIVDAIVAVVVMVCTLRVKAAWPWGLLITIGMIVLIDVVRDAIVQDIEEQDHLIDD